MRYLAIDYGERYLGLALSDDLGWTSRPLATLERKGWRPDLDRLRQTVEDKRVERLVVGLPINMNGSRGPASGKAARFAERLSEALGLPVELVDERLSSAEAHEIRLGQPQRARRRHSVHALAAALILQRFLQERADRDPEKRGSPRSGTRERDGQRRC